MGRSAFDGVSDGEWAVFAEKVVKERDELAEKLAGEAAHIRSLEGLLVDAVRERDEARARVAVLEDAEHDRAVCCIANADEVEGLRAERDAAYRAGAEAMREKALIEFFAILTLDLSPRVKERVRALSVELPKGEAVHPEAMPLRPVGAVSVLEKGLAQYGVRVTNVTEGRPTTVSIAATEHPVTFVGLNEDECVQLAPGGESVTATLLYATSRSTGHAGFIASGFLDEPGPEIANAARSALYFFVLLEEGRVWVLTRGALRDVYKKLRRGGKVTRFSLPKTPGTVRLLLPKKKLGFDLDQAVRRRGRE
jgi:hypothetical protein